MNDDNVQTHRHHYIHYMSFISCDTYTYSERTIEFSLRLLVNDKHTGMHMAIAISCCMEHLLALAYAHQYGLLLLMFLSLPPGDVALMLLRALNGDM